MLDRARILAVVILFMILILGMSFFLSFLTPENDINIGLALLVSLPLPIIFRVFGNLGLSGNLLAGSLCAVLIPMIFQTGGLYSDNTLWLLICPVLVMLFSTKRAVLTWLVGLLMFIFYLYRHSSDNPVKFEALPQHDPLYYFISVALLFSVIALIIYFFKIGEDKIIQDLQHNQRNLEKRQHELTSANLQLRQISDQLRSSNRDLESFAYAASHDLKEPLRMIGSYTSLLQRRLQGQLSNDTEEMMQFVNQGVKQMQRLLEDVLEYSRVGRGQDKIKQIDLDDVLFYIKNSLRLRIEETQTQILVEKTLPEVYARYSEMVQLFQNLISNAIKFKHPSRLPVIKISWVERQGYYHFFLADNGIGIEKTFQNRVFDLFERLHNRQEYEGSGIGLATCKKIVENFGGSIGLESTFGEGTTFHFSLPKTVFDFEHAAHQKEVFVGEKH